jgi:hypothetical protein
LEIEMTDEVEVDTVVPAPCTKPPAIIVAIAAKSHFARVTINQSTAAIVLNKPKIEAVNPDVLIPASEIMSNTVTTPKKAFPPLALLAAKTVTSLSVPHQASPSIAATVSPKPILRTQTGNPTPNLLS